MGAWNSFRSNRCSFASTACGTGEQVAFRFEIIDEQTAGPNPRSLPFALLLVVCCSAFVAAPIGFALCAIRAGRAVIVPQGRLEAPPVVPLRVFKVAAEGAIVLLFGAA